MTRKADRLYGRGSADMKGFIASVLEMVLDAMARNLTHPIHLTFYYDEGIGCVGVPLTKTVACNRKQLTVFRLSRVALRHRYVSNSKRL